MWGAGAPARARWGTPRRRPMPRRPVAAPARVYHPLRPANEWLRGPEPIPASCYSVARATHRPTTESHVTTSPGASAPHDPAAFFAARFGIDAQVMAELLGHYLRVDAEASGEERGGVMWRTCARTGGHVALRRGPVGGPCHTIARGGYRFWASQPLVGGPERVVYSGRCRHRAARHRTSARRAPPRSGGGAGAPHEALSWA